MAKDFRATPAMAAEWNSSVSLQQAAMWCASNRLAVWPLERKEGTLEYILKRIEYLDPLDRRLSPNEVTTLFRTQPVSTGVGLILGQLSLHTEALELKASHLAVAFTHEVDPTLLIRIPQCRTPEGGLYILFRVEETHTGGRFSAQLGNGIRLYSNSGSLRANLSFLPGTKGPQPAVIPIAPSPGLLQLTGTPATPPTLTIGEVRYLVSIARSVARQGK